MRRGVLAAVEHHAVSFGASFKTVLDVGANNGQFALFALERFPLATVHCFEPLPKPVRRLEHFARREMRIQVHSFGLAEAAGRAPMHVSAAMDSSSLRRMTEEQTAVFPGTHEVGLLEVETRRLDDLDLSVQRPALLKLDTQGSELDVLRGAPRSIRAIDEMLVEVSFVELYSGQALAGEVVAFAQTVGFHLAGVYSVYFDATGRCVQADFHFQRRNGSDARADHSSR